MHTSLSVATRKFDVQSVTGVPARTVNPDPKDMERIRVEQAAVGMRGMWLV
ncbi:MAG: hypothetical protein R3F47_14190 [Gammaproteobacteria bacterium]